MTRIRVNGVPHIEAEGDQKCELCGKVDETRPYGPGGKEVCFDCGMKDPKETQRRFLNFLEGRNG